MFLKVTENFLDKIEKKVFARNISIELIVKLEYFDKTSYFNRNNFFSTVSRKFSVTFRYMLGVVTFEVSKKFA